MDPQNSPVISTNSDSDDDSEPETESVQHKTGESMRLLSGRMLPRPVKPVSPSFPAYTYQTAATYDAALRKYTKQMDRYRQEVKKFDEEVLLDLERNGGVPDPLFTPRCYVGGVEISNSTCSDSRHTIAVDAEGQLRVFSTSNITTYTNNKLHYWLNFGSFTLTFNLIKIIHDWGYAIEIQIENFKPFMHKYVDSKGRAKIVICADYDEQPDEMEELCIHFTNEDKPVRFENMCIQRDMHNKLIVITAGF